MGYIRHSRCRTKLLDLSYGGETWCPQCNEWINTDDCKRVFTSAFDPKQK